MNPSAEALVLTGPNTLEHRTFDLPDVTADTARLLIEACGLCGTDHEQYSGHIAAPFSFIPGHEIVGIIDEIGDNAGRSMERRRRRPRCRRGVPLMPALRAVRTRRVPALHP